MSTPAPPIPVQEFRQILVWPFRLGLTGQSSAKAIEDGVKATLGALNGSPLWQPVADPMRHLCADAQPPSEHEYQEFVYFHPFVRRFLYDKDAPFRLYRRTGIDTVTLDLANGVTGPFEVTLDVDRVNLYVFDNGNAVLTVEVAAGCVRDQLGWVPYVRADGRPQPMTLAHAQVILGLFRRAFPPYWADGKAGLSPGMIAWGADGDQAWTCMSSAEDCIAHIEAHRRPPLAAHWRSLLKPLKFLPSADPFWDQVVDDRIPVMAYLAVPDPHAISAGDWVRLAMLDEPNGNPLPYSESHLANFTADHCQDAFWDPDAEGMSTRYLVSGYGFVAVGSSANRMFANKVREHVRRHYFQLGLIAHYQTAALLTLSDRLAMVATDDTLEAEAILKDMLQFTKRFWFPQVSGHGQARELYGLWRRHLGIDALYAEVMRKAQDLTAFLDGRADRDAADAAANLNIIATIGLTLSLVAGILGMNVLVPGQAQETEARKFALLTFVGVVGLAGLGLIPFSCAGRHNQRLGRLGLAFIVLALMGVWLRAALS